jgi:hypothetical protein
MLLLGSWICCLSFHPNIEALFLTNLWLLKNDLVSYFPLSLIVKFFQRIISAHGCVY